MGSCRLCGGKGTIHCDKCNGTGKTRNSSYLPLISELSNLANDWVKCFKCGGRGKKQCKYCKGSGHVSDD